MTMGRLDSDRLAEGFLARLAGFFAFLRGRGLPVGSGAEIDLGQALGHLALLDRDAFREACRATLAKSPEDLRTLEEAFDLFWSERLRLAAPEGTSRGVVPVNPPLRRPSPSDPAAARDRVGVDRLGFVRIGTYSPDAPPAGHPLTPLDRKRLVALAQGARRFRRHVATLPGRRFRRWPKGAIDFPRTVRRSLGSGGEWLEVHRHRRKRARAELVVLWDVSGSMQEHDSDLFALVYALQRATRRARVFAFSTDLEELTERLRAEAYLRATKAVGRSLGPAGGGTRIGRSLQEFNRRYGALIHRWTTLVILSDGWDLGETDVLGRELERLSRRAHRLVWINPYARDPRFEPATVGMQTALPYVDVLLGPRDFESRNRFPAGLARGAGRG